MFIQRNQANNSIRQIKGGGAVKEMSCGMYDIQLSNIAEIYLIFWKQMVAWICISPWDFFRRASANDDT